MTTVDSISLESLNGEAKAAIRAMSDAMIVARARWRGSACPVIAAVNDFTQSLSAQRKNRTGGLANDALRCRAKDHEIGCSSTLHPHHDQFGLTIRGDPQDLPPWFAS